MKFEGMLDRSKCPTMLVWDFHEKDAVERIVVEILANGSCYTVSINEEKDFKRGLYYKRRHRAHYKPIPGKKTRLMFPLQIIAWGCQPEQYNVVFRHINTVYGAINSIATYQHDHLPSRHEWARINEKGRIITEWKEFLKEEAD